MRSDQIGVEDNTENRLENAKAVGGFCEGGRRGQIQFKIMRKL